MKKVLCTFAAVMVLMVSATTAQEIKGVVELGYADATYWKVKPCNLDARSHELNQTCPLIAIPTPMALEKKDTPGQAFPVTLNCANTENGTFELMSKYKNGRAHFLQGTYKDKKPVLISSFNSDQGPEGGLIIDYTKMTASDRDSDPYANLMDLLRKKVCLVLQ